MSYFKDTVIWLYGYVLCCGNAVAIEMPELAKKNACVNCHAINEHVFGPAWRAVAKKLVALSLLPNNSPLGLTSIAAKACGDLTKSPYRSEYRRLPCRPFAYSFTRLCWLCCRDM